MPARSDLRCLRFCLLEAARCHGSPRLTGKRRICVPEARAASLPPRHALLPPFRAMFARPPIAVSAFHYRRRYATSSFVRCRQRCRRLRFISLSRGDVMLLLRYAKRVFRLLAAGAKTRACCRAMRQRWRLPVPAPDALLPAPAPAPR
jgi:hypothetical protein